MKIKSTIVLGIIIYTMIGQIVTAEEFKKNKVSRVMTQGLSHVGLTVTKLDESVGFFTNILGWKIVGGYPDYPSVFVSDGRILVTLWQATNPKAAIAFNRKNNVGLHHLALSVASFEYLDELYERFKKISGITIEFGPELNNGGPTKHMMIREPSGNRIEFTYKPLKKK